MDYEKNWLSKVLKHDARALIMGVVNVTPDSFYDGGRFLEVDDAVRHAHDLIEAGADIIDIGGQSTRPGSKEVLPEEQIRRVVPVIKNIRRSCPVPISIDTDRTEVAAAAIEAGVTMVNDISALQDKGMAALVARHRIDVVLMHMQGRPETMQANPVYHDVILEVLTFLRERAEYAIQNGISAQSIVLDPGIGFGKTTAQNLQLIAAIPRLRGLGFPILIGASRKSLIGELLHKPLEQRLLGSLALAVVSRMLGARILRVHDAKETREVLLLADRVLEQIG